MARLEKLPHGVAWGPRAGSPWAGPIVCTVVDDDSGFGEEGWRPVSGKSAVEVAGALVRTSMGLPAASSTRVSMDEVGGGCESDSPRPSTSPSICRLSVSAMRRSDCRRVTCRAGKTLYFWGIVFAFGRAEDGGPGLGPVFRGQAM